MSDVYVVQSYMNGQVNGEHLVYTKKDDAYAAAIRLVFEDGHLAKVMNGSKLAFCKLIQSGKLKQALALYNEKSEKNPLPASEFSKRLYTNNVFVFECSFDDKNRLSEDDWLYFEARKLLGLDTVNRYEESEND